MSLTKLSDIEITEILEALYRMPQSETNLALIRKLESFISVYTH